MKKRAFSLFLAICLTLGLVGMVAPAAMAVEVGVATEGTYGDNITWGFDEATGVLTVGGEGSMPGGYFNYVRPDWKDFAEQIVEVIVLEGVDKVSYGSFSGLSALERVTLQEGVVYIDMYAFGDCEKLTSVTLSPGLRTIGEKAFYNCAALTRITLPDGVVTLQSSVFDHTAITSIHIPASLTSIDKAAFRDCSMLEEFRVDPDNPEFCSDSRGVLLKKSGNKLYPYRVPMAYEGGYEIPQGTKSIDAKVFIGCHKLTSVIIPNTVTTIEAGAFWGCESLTRVDIPASVTSIVNTAFTRCYSLQAIFVDKANPNYSSANGALLSKDGTELIAVPGGIEVDFEIPASVKTIKPYAFRGCDSLTVLNIPEGVTTIEDFAFIECANLTKITFPASLTKLGVYLSGGGEDGYPNPDKTIEFAGDMPEMTIFAFDNTDVQVYYPKNNATWDGINDLQEPTGHTVTWIPYTPHVYGQWQVLKNPTYAEQGLKKRVCSDCGQEETRAIARLTAVFTDIGPADYFYSPVLWAVGEGITTGTTPTTFTPNGTATRAQVVTFLWRAMGEPDPKTTKNPFTDVKPSEYYYKAVLWAAENGITTGATATTFNPDGACTRAQVVTFLWRNAGCPQPGTTSHPFTDLNKTEYYYTAVLWAVEEEITNGMTPTTFVPDRTCTRGQIVTFLYRDEVR